ncbi:hypothetical protein Tco_0357148 [Tanacetum coccineum]
MADLTFVDSHNMVAYLEKSEDNVDFAEIVDFLNASPIRYALTVSQTVYVSYIEQFWSTTKIKTINNETQIRAKVDGKTIVITESSVRRDIHFDDEDGITCLTNTEIFENLQLMGYEKLSDKLTFLKPFFSPQWKYLIHTILQCLSSKSTAWNEFGTNIASAVICLAKNQKFNFSKLIFDGMLRNLDPNSKKFLMYLRFLQLFLNNQIENLEAVFNDEYDTPSHTKKVFANMRRQGKDFSGTLTPLFPSMLASQEVEGEADEIVYEETRDSVERAGTTTASLDAEQDNGSGPRSQDTILGDRPTQTRFERLSKQSNDPPLSRVNILGSGEDSMKLNELMEICARLSERVLTLKNIKTTQNLEITNLKKRVKTLEKKKKARTPQIKRRLFKRMQRSQRSGGCIVDGQEVVVSYVGGWMVLGGGDIFKNEKCRKKSKEKSKDKSKEKGVSSETATTITRGVTMQEPKKGPDQVDEEMAKRLADELEAELEEEEKLAKQEKKLAKLNFMGYYHRILFDKEMKRVNSFVPMDSEVVEGSGKKTKSSRKETINSSKDDEAINIESLATKYPIVDWKTHLLTEDKMYYQIIRVDGSEKYYRIFSAMLDDFDKQDVLDLYRLVKERFETTSPEGYDRLIWGDLITLFEASEEDEIWKAQQDYTLISWRLYDSCGVHVLLMDTGISIHMMVEKKYPLTSRMLFKNLGGEDRSVVSVNGLMNFSDLQDHS